MVVIGLVIGMGIFRTPAEVAAQAGSTKIFFAAWIAGGACSFIGSLIFAEIGARHPRAGGFYELFSHCYHPSFAFMVNWITVMSNAASTALVALMGSDYLAPMLFPHWAGARVVIAAGSTLLLFAVNWAGIKMGARVLNVLMFIKLGLMVFVVSSVFLVEPAAAPVNAAATGTFNPWITFFLCFSPVFFTYGGYQQTMNFGGDVQDAKKRLPKAILLGMGIVLVIYLLINYAYVHTIGFSDLGKTATPASDIAETMIGSTAKNIVSILMFFSVMAYVNVSMMSNPRVYFAMAKDEVLPSVFHRVNSRTQTQEIALIAFTLIILFTFLLADSIEGLLKYVMFFDSISFIAAAASIFIFRKKARGKNYDGFRIPLYPVLPVIFILIYASLVVTIFISKPFTALVGLGLFLFGLPLYYILHYYIHKNKVRHSNE